MSIKRISYEGRIHYEDKNRSVHVINEIPIDKEVESGSPLEYGLLGDLFIGWGKEGEKLYSPQTKTYECVCCLGKRRMYTNHYESIEAHCKKCFEDVRRLARCEFVCIENELLTIIERKDSNERL